MHRIRLKTTVLAVDPHLDSAFISAGDAGLHQTILHCAEVRPPLTFVIDAGHFSTTANPALGRSFADHCSGSVDVEHRSGLLLL